MGQVNQYLTFKLDNEIFGLSIHKVREVLDFIKVTKVPQTPDYMIGVINLRGSVVPVVDLKQKFGMSITERTINTCIIIVEIDISSERAILGILADSVQEVLELDDKDIEPAPRLGTSISTEFIKGMGKHNDNFIILLDIDRIFMEDSLLNFDNQSNLEQVEV
jgi:purine-binding chemotaxis protein CheW